MKNYIRILTVLLGLAFNAIGAEEPFGYITQSPIVVYGYDLITGVSQPKIVLIANPDLKFRQIGDVRADSFLGQVYVIQFWEITDERESITNDKTKIKHCK